MANPTDVVKNRLQAELPGTVSPYRNTFHAFAVIAREEGLGSKGLFRGVGPTVVRAALVTSLQLGTYDHVKHMLLKYPFFGEDLKTHFVASMIAGLFTNTGSITADVVKTRVMNDAAGRYKGPMDCFFKILRTEGPLALFKGWVPSYYRLGPHTVISLIMYEEIRRIAGIKAL